MEDILASIRRILSEDETAPGDAPPAASENKGAGADVLVLDPSMLVQEESHDQAAAPEARPVVAVAQVEAAEPALIAPEAAAAAASSVDNLVRTLTAERSMQVHSGGPTIEDLVREELRPLLKAWLDANLPPLVERLVRAEIERVVGRAVT